MKANPWKSALSSAAFTFIGLFSASLLGFIGKVVDWANNGGTHAFPAMGGLALALVSAAGAAVTGLVTFVIRWAQTKGYAPGEAPQFATAKVPDEAGLAQLERLMFTVVCAVGVTILFVAIA